MRRNCHNCKNRGLCMISLGVGILLSMVLPVGVIIFVSALALIALGITWLH